MNPKAQINAGQCVEPRIQREALHRIAEALAAAIQVASHFTPGNVRVELKAPGHAVTEADRAINHVLQESLVRGNDGWLSEETADDFSRLEKRNVWIVDPLDGTREFVMGIPEWCISIAFVIDGTAVAGGIANPATREIFLGSRDTGLLYNGKLAAPSARNGLLGSVVLASRSEVERGEWKRFEAGSFVVRPMGSVAYKLARVAAGLADATWTLTPKHEWDVAAGVALMEASGGFVSTLDLSRPAFNRKSPWLPGLLAWSSGLSPEFTRLLKPYLDPACSLGAGTDK